MKRFLPISAVLLLILLAPSSFAARAASNVNERRIFEIQELKAAIGDAQKAGSEAALDKKVIDIANEVALQDPTISPKEALNEVIFLLDGEEWTDTGWHRYGIIDSLLRSQGLAIDDKGTVWYSGEKSLLRAKSLVGGDAKLHIEPIPSELSKLGDNHVGDIDVADGKVYVGIEDGSKYNNPYIGVYDGKTLKFEKAFRLPHDQQLEGVPWAAVDPSKNVMYSSEYYHPTAINVYDMTTGKTLPQIPISRQVPSAQGAKVIGGMMYITSDGSNPKAVFKINLATGTVIQVATLDSEVTELEGLAISHGADGMALNVLAIGYGKHHASAINKRAELHVFKLKTPSLRDQLRASLRR